MSTVQEIADAIAGTCSSDFDEEIDNFTLAECEEFDSLIFLCEQCGWWCRRDEESEQPDHCFECCEDA